MKKNKWIFILFFILIVHSVISIVNNVWSLSYLSNIKQVALNPIGKFYKRIVNPVNIAYYPDILRGYSNYAGIDRGYAFYSPNLGRNKVEYNFISNKTNIPVSVYFNTKESKVKYMSMSMNLTNMFDNKKIRTQLINDISVFVLNQHKEIKEMNFIVSIKRIRLLDEIDHGTNEKKIDAYHIKKVK